MNSPVALYLGTLQPCFAAGRTGAEGRVVGAMVSLFAVAALIRFGIVAAQLNSSSDARLVLEWAPPAIWTAAAFLLWRSRQRAAESEA